MNQLPYADFIAGKSQLSGNFRIRTRLHARFDVSVSGGAYAVGLHEGKGRHVR
jgi:hypothetical protein